MLHTTIVITFSRAINFATFPRRFPGHQSLYCMGAAVYSFMGAGDLLNISLNKCQRSWHKLCITGTNPIRLRTIVYGDEGIQLHQPVYTKNVVVTPLGERARQSRQSS